MKTAWLDGAASSDIHILMISLEVWGKLGLPSTPQLSQNHHKNKGCHPPQR